MPYMGSYHIKDVVKIWQCATTSDMPGYLARPRAR